MNGTKPSATRLVRVELSTFILKGLGKKFPSSIYFKLFKDLLK
jgi:hypothetical protein